MPGLLVFHVHHTFCNFHSDWVLQDLPTFLFSLLNPVVGFCRICQLSFFSLLNPVVGFCSICQLSFSHFSSCSVSRKPVNTKPE